MDSKEMELVMKEKYVRNCGINGKDMVNEGGEKNLGGYSDDENVEAYGGFAGVLMSETTNIAGV